MTTNKDQIKILIVDDDDETRSTYAEILRNHNFNVIEAKDGVEGLDTATSESGIDIIFTGIVMPRMDGFQFIRAMKENMATANIPVVVNSHLGRETDRKIAQELGAVDFIVRGTITPAQAVQRIIKHTNKGKKYLLKLEPFALDGQTFIEDLRLPKEFKCDNCGGDLALNASIATSENAIEGKIKCSNCDKQF